MTNPETGHHFEPQPEHVEKEKTLDASRISRMLFAIFRLDQGKGAIPPVALQWIKAMHPDYHVTNDVMKSVKAQLLERVSARVLPGNLHVYFDLRRVTEDIEKMCDKFEDVMNEGGEVREKTHKHFSEAVPAYEPIRNELSILERMKQIDLYAAIVGAFLVHSDYAKIIESPEGRHRQDENRKDIADPHGNPDLDKWSSLLIDYCVKGNPTGSEEIDHLGKYAVSALLKYIHNPKFLGGELEMKSSWYISPGFNHAETVTKFQALIEKYNQKHPGEEVRMEDFEKVANAVGSEQIK